MSESGREARENKQLPYRERYVFKAESVNAVRTAGFSSSASSPRDLRMPLCHRRPSLQTFLHIAGTKPRHDSEQTNACHPVDIVAV